MAFTYRGLSAKLDRHIVTDAEIDRQLQRLQQQTPRIAVVTDRPTESGDEVVLDYAGFCDGVQFPGGTAEKQTLVLGSGTFIPGFEEQLLDKVPGEQVTVHVTFPQQYHSADLAGKAAEFRCTIHEIRLKTAYDLDDTFAKEVGGCDTLEQMRQKLAQSLQAYTDERGEMELQDNLLRQAAATLDMEVSEAQIEAALDEHMNTLKAQLAQQGLSIEMYCQFMGTDEKQLRSDARAEAEQSVRVQAAIEKIIELEQLTATEEEKGEAIALIARQNRMTVEQLKSYFSPEFEAAVVRSVLTSKVMGLIRQNANIEE
jgi:trigger factor